MPRKYVKKAPKCTDDHTIDLAAEEVINDKKSILQTARKYNITQVALRNCVRSKRGSRKKFFYSHETLLAAVRHLRKKTHSLSWVSKHYGIPRSTLSARLNSECPFERKITGKGTALPKEEEEAIKKWILETGKNEGTQAWQTIANTVQEVLNQRGLKVFKNNNKPTSGWLQAFLRRHPELRKIRIGCWTTGIVGDMKKKVESHSQRGVKGVPQSDTDVDTDEEFSMIDEEEEEDLESTKYMDEEEEIPIKSKALNIESSVEDTNPRKIQVSAKKKIADLKSKVDKLKENKNGVKFQPKIGLSDADPLTIGTNSTINNLSMLSASKGKRIVVAPIGETEDIRISKGTTDMLLDRSKRRVGRRGFAMNGGTVETEGNDGVERLTCKGKENIGVGEKGRLGMRSQSLKEKIGRSDVEAECEGIPAEKMRLGVTPMDVNTKDDNSIKILLKGFKKRDNSLEQDKNVFECTDEKVDKFLLVANPKGSNVSMTCLVLPKNAKTNPVLVSVVQNTHPSQNVENAPKEEEFRDHLRKTGFDGAECIDNTPLAHIEDSMSNLECPTMIPGNHTEDFNKTHSSPSEKQMSFNLNSEDSDFLSLSNGPDNSSCVHLSPLEMLSDSDDSFDGRDLVMDLEACAFDVEEPEIPMLVEKLPEIHDQHMKEFPCTDTVRRKTINSNGNILDANKNPRIRVKTVSSLMTSTEIETACEALELDGEPLTDPLPVIRDSQQRHSGGFEAMYNVVTKEIGMDKLLHWSGEEGQSDDHHLHMWERSRTMLVEAKIPLTPTANRLSKSNAMAPLREVEETSDSYVYDSSLKESSNDLLGSEEELSCHMSEEEYILFQESMWENDVKPEIKDIKPLPEIKDIKPLPEQKV